VRHSKNRNLGPRLFRYKSCKLIRAPRGYRHIYRARQKSSPYKLLPITHQRSKLILQCFAGALNVYTNIHLRSYISLRLITRKLMWIKCSYPNTFEHLILTNSHLFQQKLMTPLHRLTVTLLWCNFSEKNLQTVIVIEVFFSKFW